MKQKLIIVLLLLAIQVYGQENEKKYPQDINKKHEIKLNALTLIAAKWIDVSYENLINDESSFGIAATLNTDIDLSTLNYAITPYYRRYFGEKFARGFFLEGFGSLYSAEESIIFTNNGIKREFETGFAVGISIGGKFVTKSGFAAELLLGFGRNLTGNLNDEGFGRVGISVGYRF